MSEQERDSVWMLSDRQGAAVRTGPSSPPDRPWYRRPLGLVVVAAAGLAVLTRWPVKAGDLRVELDPPASGAQLAQARAVILEGAEPLPWGSMAELLEGVLRPAAEHCPYSDFILRVNVLTRPTSGDVASTRYWTAWWFAGELYVARLGREHPHGDGGADPPEHVWFATVDENGKIQVLAQDTHSTAAMGEQACRWLASRTL